MGDRSPNRQLRALMDESRWTLQAAAKAVNQVAGEHSHTLSTTRAGVKSWLDGGTPNASTTRYLAEALSRRLHRLVTPADLGYGDREDAATPGADNDPVAGLSQLGRADVNRRGLLSGAVYSLAALALPVSVEAEHGGRAAAAAAGRTIGWAEVESARAVLRAFDSADERLGGGHGRTALVEYLSTDIAAFLTAPASGEVRAAMFSVATELAYLCGWKAHDLMLEGLAQRYYLHAWRLSRHADDPALPAYVARILAHQAFDLGHAQPCVGLAERAVNLVRGRVDAHTLAVFELTQARAYGVLGERGKAIAALGRAERADAAASAGDTRPGWVKMRHNRGQYESHFAKTLLDLGEYGRAEEHFHASHHQRDKSSHSLIAGLSQAWLAEAQFRHGKLGEALANWAGAKARYSGIQSQRAVQTMVDMRAMLGPLRNRKIREVELLLAT